MLSRHTNHHKNQSGFMAVTVSDTVNVCGHRTPSVYADTAFGYLHSTPQPPSVTIHVPTIDPPAAVYCAHKADSIRPTFAPPLFPTCARLLSSCGAAGSSACMYPHLILESASGRCLARLCPRLLDQSHPDFSGCLRPRVVGISLVCCLPEPQSPQPQPR